jgi:hypothetical protein
MRGFVTGGLQLLKPRLGLAGRGGLRRRRLTSLLLCRIKLTLLGEQPVQRLAIPRGIRLADGRVNVFCGPFHG